MCAYLCFYMSVEVVSESLHFSRRPPVLLVLALCALLCRHMTRQQMQTVYSHLRYRSNPLGVFASLRFVTAAFIAPFSQTFTSNSVNLPGESKGHIFQRLPENICKHAKAPYTHTIKRYSAGGMMREEVGAVPPPWQTQPARRGSPCLWDKRHSRRQAQDRGGCAQRPFANGAAGVERGRVLRRPSSDATRDHHSQELG